MQDPNAVEIVHQQSADRDFYQLKRYLSDEIIMESKNRNELIACANKNKFVICTRPVKRY